MKKYSIGVPGMVVAAIVGSVMLKNGDDVATSVHSAGDTTREVVCTAQGMLGNMVNIMQNCEASPTGTTVPNGPSPDASGD